jgi:hypothetical protein
VDYLTRNYIEQGKLGTKSALGGFYPPGPPSETAGRFLVLDVRLAAPGAISSMGPPRGQILSVSRDGKQQTVLMSDQLLPDGITVDHATDRMFWTNMGIPGRPDGTICSAALDGSDIRTIVVPGTINTPKQITIDTVAQKIYFCDREGCAVYRCNLDGSALETLISRHATQKSAASNVQDWCVGIAVSPKFNKFYWTQKGAPKSGTRRIFCADRDIASAVLGSGDDQDEEQCIMSGLPEPIDLEIDEERGELYWTDRGELPLGNALYRVKLDSNGRPQGKHEIVVRGLHEAIGLSIDRGSGDIFLTDLGGGIYCCDRDGKRKKTLCQGDGRAFTGIVCL